MTSPKGNVLGEILMLCTFCSDMHGIRRKPVKFFLGKELRCVLLPCIQLVISSLEMTCGIFQAYSWSL